jgi:hypothetical protein
MMLKKLRDEAEHISGLTSLQDEQEPKPMTDGQRCRAEAKAEGRERALWRPEARLPHENEAATRTAMRLNRLLIGDCELLETITALASVCHSTGLNREAKKSMVMAIDKLAERVTALRYSFEFANKKLERVPLALECEVIAA